MNRPESKHNGFTLIELMVVVAILGILSTLLIVGISKLQTNAKRQQTAQLLENCRAMWAEYDSVKRLHIDPFVTYCPGLVSSAQSNGATGDGFDRFGLETFLTQSMMSLMRSQPSIQAATDKYSAGKLVINSKVSNPFAAVNPGTGPYSLNIFPPGQTQSAFSVYTSPIANFVTSQFDSELYLYIHVPLSGSAPPPDSGSWLPVSAINASGPIIDSTTPVFLDAWGNPIICVIGGKLGMPPTSTQGLLTAGGQTIQIISPDQRLFFASAGPDGDFSKGDDNLYSFQK